MKLRLCRHPNQDIGVKFKGMETATRDDTWTALVKLAPN